MWAGGWDRTCILAAMDAKPWLVEVGCRLREAGLEAVLIGNAAAALQGAPVTPDGRGTWRSWRSWRRPLKKRHDRTLKLAAVARESERGLREMIRRWQALPPSRRTHFLRKRVGFRMTAL
jgi:hypothetical protein